MLSSEARDQVIISPSFGRKVETETETRRRLDMVYFTSTRRIEGCTADVGQAIIVADAVNAILVPTGNGQDALLRR